MQSPSTGLQTPFVTHSPGGCVGMKGALNLPGKPASAQSPAPRPPEWSHVVSPPQGGWWRPEAQTPQVELPGLTQLPTDGQKGVAAPGHLGG